MTVPKTAPKPATTTTVTRGGFGELQQSTAAAQPAPLLVQRVTDNDGKSQILRPDWRESPSLFSIFHTCTASRTGEDAYAVDPRPG